MIGQSPQVGGVVQVLATPAPELSGPRAATVERAADPGGTGAAGGRARSPRARNRRLDDAARRLADEDDTMLIRAYRGGDVRAFEVFFDRHRDRIRNLCLRFLPAEAAEDAVQDAFLQFVRTIDRVDESYRVSAWIQRIAVNLCHDELRRQGRRTRVFEPASEITEQAMMAVADVDRTRQPESAQELRRTRQLVWDVAATLPPRQRTVLALRELHGLPCPVIAARLGTTTSAVETLLHRGRERFKAEFLRLEGAQPGIAACRTTARLVEDLASLRPHQLRRVTTHLDVCHRCRLRHGPALAPHRPETLAS
jgi:RNA polymerase sigma-70 factor, ECF subfamily